MSEPRTNTLPPTDEVAELKPCPFCGSPDHLSAIRIGSAANGYYPFAVRCRHLDCDEVQGPTGNGKVEAVAAWNLRTPARPAPTDVELDELAKVAREAVEMKARFLARGCTFAEPIPGSYDALITPETVLKLIAALRAPAVPREVGSELERELLDTLKLIAGQTPHEQRSREDPGREHYLRTVLISLATRAVAKAETVAALRASPTPAGGEGEEDHSSRAVLATARRGLAQPRTGEG